MKNRFILILSILSTLVHLIVPGITRAQEMVKVNILLYDDRVPPVPANAKEAFTRCTLSDTRSSVDASPYYKALNDTVKALQDRFEKILKQLQEPMTEAYKKIDAAEVQKKMAGMSQSEQMKYAMELNKQMGIGQKPMTPESPKVNAALKEANTTSMNAAKDYEGMKDELSAKVARQEKFEQQHRDIDTWETQQEEKLPQVSGGEMSWPEPKAFRALKIQTADKHIAVANEYLKAMHDDFQKTYAKAKQQYGAFEEKLEAVNYGDDARNQQMKQILVSKQMGMLNPLGALLGTSKDATQEAAKWYILRVQAEAIK